MLYLNASSTHRVELLAQGYIVGSEKESYWELLAEALKDSGEDDQWLNVKFHTTIEGLDAANIQKKAFDQLLSGGLELNLFEKTLNLKADSTYVQNAGAYITPIPEPLTLSLIGFGIAALTLFRYRHRN